MKSGAPRSISRSASAHLAQTPFTGVGGSGIDFFPTPAHLDLADRRDLRLLEALGAALDAAASGPMSSAFGGSADQEDYTWGTLHRVQLPHAIGDPFEIPPSGGFTDLAPTLPGIPRDGGFSTVNVGSYFLDIAATPNARRFEFFENGASMRLLMSPGVSDPRDGSQGRISMPGGQSADPTSAFFANLMAEWLTVRHHPLYFAKNRVALRPGGHEIFSP